MSAQNTSSAVMQQRHEAPDALDDFPTPPWATRALLAQLHGRFLIDRRDRCWEPACNRGHMVKPLREIFSRVIATDVHDYGWGGQESIKDFLLAWDAPSDLGELDWVITNPPFRLAEDFARRAFQVAQRGVALFVRSAFLEGQQRHADLFVPHPPRLILQFAERVVLHKGRLAPDGSTATAYCWIVWTSADFLARRGKVLTEFDWIAPCRRRFEREGDYA